MEGINVMIKVSVIIPVYNTEKYVIRCLESIRKQNYNNIQVIIINDGSTDNSEEIISNYLKRYCLKYEYYKKENGGLSSARNYGMNYADGDYLFFLDSDDYLSDDAIDSLVSNSGEADIVIGDFIYVDDKEEKKHQQYSYFDVIKVQELDNIGYYKYFYESKYGISACNKLYNRSFIKNTDVYFQRNDVIYAEDLLFNLKVLKSNPVVKVIHKGTYYYCYNEASITHSYKNDLAKRFSALISDYVEYNSKEDRSVAYAIANAVNTICAQECFWGSTMRQLKIFQNGLDRKIQKRMKEMLRTTNGLQMRRKIDYYISIKYIFTSVVVICAYQRIKRRIVK